MTGAPRILTIEDEPTVRGGIVAYLEDSGFELFEAGDGLSGLELFRRQIPDVVLCDLRLPGMAGLDVLGTIVEESPETPVIVVSGVALVADAVQALKRGAWDFVMKPIQDMGVLESAIGRVLERVNLRRQNHEYRAHLESLNRELRRALTQFRVDAAAGRKLQFQLLPDDNATFGEYAVTRRLYPSLYLSGDFVDYFPIDDRQLGFYIADVSGHGAASAFITVMLKTLMGQYREALAQDGDQTILHPEKTLQRLDAALRSQNVDKHLTLCFGVLDWRAHSLAWSSGGQFPYPLLHDGYETHSLNCRGCPVGLLDSAKFHCRYMSLPQQFVLLLASDGILELLPQQSLGERYAALRSHLTNTSVTIDELRQRMGLVEDRELPDDVALLMISRHPTNA
jgi:sigma-B regulation protein RsbU (phosphoserine phosphatase)